MAKFCKSCGRELADEQIFCPACGTKADEVQAPMYTEAPAYDVAPEQTAPDYQQSTAFEYQQGGVGVQVAKPPMDKNKMMLIGGVVAVVAVVVILLIVFLGKGGSVSASTPEEAGQLMAKAKFTADFQTQSGLLFYDVVEENEFEARKEYEQYAAMASSMYGVNSFEEFIKYSAEQMGQSGVGSVEGILKIQQEQKHEELVFEYGQDFEITTIATQTPFDAEDFAELKSWLFEKKANVGTDFNRYAEVDVEKITAAAEVKVNMNITGSLKSDVKERTYTAVNYDGTWKIVEY